jgi:hypothetical protein
MVCWRRCSPWRSAGSGGGCMKLRSASGLTASAVLVACSLEAQAYLLIVAGATAAEQAYQVPAATEVIKLRSTCDALGQQILEGNFIRSALYQEQFSRYSPRANRCYVEMRVQTLDLSQHSNRFGRYLYDGQTKEMLAFAQIQNGKKSGRVFDMYHRTKSFENAGWDDASEYIHAMMTDDYTVMTDDRR